MSSLQDQVASFIEQNRLRCDAATRALDLASEFGEVAKEILKASDYGKQPIAASDGLGEELGDLAFSLYALAAELNVDLDVSTTAALQKYRNRPTTKGDAGSGR